MVRLPYLIVACIDSHTDDNDCESTAEQAITVQWHTGCGNMALFVRRCLHHAAGLEPMSNALPTEQHRGVLSNDHHLFQYTAANAVP